MSLALFIIFFLLWCFSLVIIVVGLIKPKLVLYWGNQEKKTRGRVLLYYGISSVVFFIVFISSFLTFGASLPEPTQEVATAQAEKKVEEAKAKNEAEEKVKKETEEKVKDKRDKEATKEVEDKVKTETKEEREVEESESLGLTVEEFVKSYNKAMGKFDKDAEEELGEEIPNVFVKQNKRDDGNGFLIDYYIGAESPNETGNFIETIEIRGVTNGDGKITYMSYFLYRYDETLFQLTMSTLPSALNSKLPYKKGYNALLDLVDGKKKSYENNNIKYTYIVEDIKVIRFHISHKDDSSVPSFIDF